MKAVLKQEFRRKSIHILAGLSFLFLYSCSPSFTLIFASLGSLLYLLAEILRHKGVKIPFITSLINWGSRKTTTTKLELAPILLALGVILTLYLFPFSLAWVSIVGVIFGDGLASIGGLSLGGPFYPFSHKRFTGSLFCFLGTVLFSFLLQTLFPSIFPTIPLEQILIMAFIITALELIPIKDFDNFIIPFGSAFIFAQIFPV